MSRVTGLIVLADPELKKPQLPVSKVPDRTYYATPLKADIGYDQQENQGYDGLFLLCVSIHLLILYSAGFNWLQLFKAGLIQR